MPAVGCWVETPLTLARTTDQPRILSQAPIASGHSNSVGRYGAISGENPGMSANIEPQVSTNPPSPKATRSCTNQTIWTGPKQGRKGQEGQQDAGQQRRKVRGILTAESIFYGIDFVTTRFQTLQRSRDVGPAEKRGKL